jgi:hypothetical protein
VIRQIVLDTDGIGGNIASQAGLLEVVMREYPRTLTAKLANTAPAIVSAGLATIAVPVIPALKSEAPGIPESQAQANCLFLRQCNK